MLKIYCPVCHKRTCDSEKNIKIFKYSSQSPDLADIIIKCTRCKAQLGICVIDATDSEVSSNTL